MLAVRRVAPAIARSCRSLSTVVHNNVSAATNTHHNRELTQYEKDIISPMIRVDQSGEVGAYYIYKGQIAVLGGDPKLRPLLEMMWDQEKHHLKLFSDLVGEHRVRPSLLRPLWEVAGFAVGAGTALLGKEAAMACTEAVETVIGDHYNEQLRELHELKDPSQQLDYLSKVRKKKCTCVCHGKLNINKNCRRLQAVETMNWNTMILLWITMPVKHLSIVY